MGVLCYSAMELVILFGSADEMQFTTCRAIKASVLCEEAIAVRASTPSKAHIRAYITTVDGESSGTQDPSLEGEGEPHSPAENPHPGGETLHYLQADLSDLADQELHQLLEDLHKEVTLCELNAPPAALHQCLGETQQEMGTLDADDQEVTFPGRGVFSPGQSFQPLAPAQPHGGWPLQGPPPQGLPWDNPFQPPVPTWPDGGWAPQGPPPQHPMPAQPNADAGHLINTLASGLCLGMLRINTFSGKAMPRKTKVSFEQWYHEVQCVKGHYLESVVWESIIRSLKGAAADMARYMGPTASVSDILQKLMVIFGMVASFDVLMQNFYKVTQGNHEKVPSFTTRLEGTLNQIWLKCPRQIANQEVLWHFKDHLFHGVHKHIRDSIRYLYSNPETTYVQLMVMAHKAESKMEEAKDKVRARSAVTTEVVDSLKELSNQISKLMAALTRAEQGNCPVSAPNSPGPQVLWVRTDR